MEGEEGDVGRHQREGVVGGEREVSGWVKDEDRKPRGMEEMEAEAKWLREEMERDAKEEEGKEKLRV